MKRCALCVETDTRPTSQFDENGICLPCRSVSAHQIAHIDWDERHRILQEIIQWGKTNTTCDYDCIIGVSGGKDSTRQALEARAMGFNPLLVSCVYPPEQVTQLGSDNLANLIELGFDTLIIQPAPINSKEMMKNCFYKFGNLFNASELTLYASLPITAIAYGIPLILLGENPALAFGTAVGSTDYNGNKMKYMNTLQGGDPNRFKCDWMSDKDLFWYQYPTDNEMEEANLRIVYLGYFIADFNDHTNAKIAVEHGMKVREGEDALPENIGGISTDVALDDDFVLVNQMLKYLKFGFGKATQEVGVAVRAGLMSREDAMALIRLYDGKCAPKYIDAFCRYIGITPEEFWRVAESYRDQTLFTKNTAGSWELRKELLR